MIGIGVVIDSDPDMSADYFLRIFRPEYVHMQRRQEIFMGDNSFLNRFLLNMTQMRVKEMLRPYTLGP